MTNIDHDPTDIKTILIHRPDGFLDPDDRNSELWANVVEFVRYLSDDSLDGDFELVRVGDTLIMGSPEKGSSSALSSNGSKKWNPAMKSTAYGPEFGTDGNIIRPIFGSKKSES